MKERNISLDAMKAFVILLVMIGHVLIWNKINDPYIYRMIDAVQMPAFMMISGYISGFKPPIDTFSQWKNIINKRAISYALPFFTWLFLKQWDNLLQGINKTLFQLDRGLWFLMTLFVINVILYTSQVLSKKFREKGKLVGFLGFGIIFAMISSVFVLQIIIKNAFLSPILTLRYIPAFLAGYLVSMYKEEIVKVVKNKLQFIIFVISVALFVYMCVVYNYQSAKSYVIFVMPIIEGLIGCYIIFYVFLKGKKNVIKEKLAWVGQYTLEIYTVHFHFAKIFNPGKGNLDFELYSWEGFTFVIASFVAMSMISAIFIYMVKQVPITNLLMFGRRDK